MSERGRFALDRGWFKHPAFKDEPFTEREAWAWLISEAAYRPHKRRVASVKVSLNRGQAAHSLRFMAEQWKWTDSRVRRFLTRLQAEGMIDTNSDAGVTVITLLNYSKYQFGAGSADAEPTHDRRKIEEGNNCNTFADADGDGSQAKYIFKVVAEQAGLDAHSLPIEWASGLQRVRKWLADGWTPDIIISAVQLCMRRKETPDAPRTIGYFEKEIARQHALQAKPLPQAVVVESQLTKVTRRPDRIGEAINRLRERLAEDPHE